MVGRAYLQKQEDGDDVTGGSKHTGRALRVQSNFWNFLANAISWYLIYHRTCKTLSYQSD